MKLISNSAIVTGAAQGIGKGIAERLMREGANVLLFGRTQSSLEATADELNRLLEGRARAVPCAGDVTRAADVARGIEVAERELGVPGILVNNAGTVTMSPLVDMAEENFDQVLTVNVKGPFLFTWRTTAPPRGARAPLEGRRAGARVPWHPGERGGARGHPHAPGGERGVPGAHAR